MTISHALLVLGMLAGANEPVDYARDIKPVLAERCYACHGALKQEAGLRLDTAEAMRAGGDSGPAIVPGKLADSLLLERVADPDPATRMPPEEEGAALEAETIALLRAWVTQGAAGPADEQPEADPREHWAFRAPVRPPIPPERDRPWIRNPIDAFISAEHDRLELAPQPTADKRLLLRRVYLDLIGLPPSLEEQEAFLADGSPDAYEKVVDRLLESPRHGERWGRHWMDIWRYSDWWGLGAEVRNSQKHIWHWRDWIIESLNDDLGYDEMLRQMLAADELYPDDLPRLRATGFLARHYFKFNRNTWLDNTVEHTAKAFLGLTLNCAKCHDHKYDPLAQQDYYHFRAFFEPYQIRTDQLPGEVDPEKDGIPRAFDCHLDAPTYLLIRGDEKQPLKDQPLGPDLPALLRFTPLEIEPVALPVEAHQPGLRPWVLDNHLEAAEREIAAARTALDTARLEHTKAETIASQVAAQPDPESATKATLVASDDFSTARPDLWVQVNGDWKYEEGRLVQHRAGADRAVLRLKTAPPTDFEVRVRFTITGGQMWKSVGVTFDSVSGNGENNELFAYLSAYAQGPKVQLAYKQGGGQAYPSDAAQARKVELGEPQELVVRVRGTLVNVTVNGEHALAWRSPLPRKPGSIELITYDAQAAFSGFELAELSATDVLIEPAATGSASSMPPGVEEATAAVSLAERTLAAAELQPDALRARAAADQARAQQPPAQDVDRLVREAARWERLIAQAKAAEELARAELNLVRADADKTAELEKKVASARDVLAKATAALDQPGESYTPLRGAVKTIESPTETAESLNRPFPATSTGRRTALARWLTDPRNPLTARVAVNHIWTRHFNAPLVPSLFDFGRKGLPPTHPELLDWLAVELMENGWSMRHLHRLIVTSNAYRMSSSAAGAATNVDRDPENRYYWRMNPSRMESQVVRDALLSLAGDLDPSVGGPPIHPVKDQSSKRRSLYFVHSHNEHHRFLSMFDDADVLECYRREQSIVPQQALALANSKQALEAAERIAAGIEARWAESSHAGSEELTDDVFIRDAFQVVLGSVPNADELRACRESLEAWLEVGQPADAQSGQRRARTRLVHALLNHNDFVTVR